MRNDLLYCQSSILKNAPPPPNMVARPRLLQQNFQHLILIKTNIGTSPHLTTRGTDPVFGSVMRMV